MREVAIAGVGYSPLTRKSERTVLSQAAEAARNAMADAGIERDAIDGVASFSVLNDSVSCEAVATALALPQLRYVLDFQQGGQSPSIITYQAAMAVATGQAEAVIVFRALNGRSGIRVGSGAFAGGAAQFRYPIGYNAYLMYIAMWARRYMHEVGATQEDLASVAIAQRAYAELNDRAILRKPLDMDSYRSSPWIAEPFRAADCTTEVDGACALLVTSLERARDLAQPPVRIASGAYAAGARPGLDIGDQLLTSDFTHNYGYMLRDELFGKAGIGPGDVDVAEIYDCFTSTVLMTIEGLGFAERGGAGAFIRSGATGLNGSLPMNTHGGLLAEGYLHGMNTIAEAVLQVQGRGGDRQAPRHEVAVATSGALNDGSALVLTADR